ncbi:jasmonate O-methyltransferase-like [Prosopis cineraria]|uniref:jasmonate O-methyltransferase-like n=1 Tax=Prosopis cineraria TaxID=364024 RepID=UPI0024108A9A|nr:jasmonate O-methyltransferase-like [Prosopis cineraria]
MGIGHSIQAKKLSPRYMDPFELKKYQPDPSHMIEPEEVPNSLSEAKIADDDKGTIYVTSISHPWYAEQFKEDFKLFLRSRSKELVPEGGMLLTFTGRYDTSERITALGLIRTILNHMVAENLIEEKLELFQVPNYHARADEVMKIIEGSFSVKRLESIKTGWDGSILDEEDTDSSKDDNDRAKSVVKLIESIFGPLLRAHFGKGIMDNFFLRLQKIGVSNFG